MFQSEGNFKVKIKDVVLAEPRFGDGDPNAFDVCILVENVAAPEQSDWWRGEMSSNYGKGAVSHMTQAQLTMQTLSKLGFNSTDLTTLKDAVVGKETEAWVKASTPNGEGKVFYNVRGIGGSGNSPKALESDKIKARMQALIGQAVAPSAAPAPAPTPAPAQSAPVNPFL